MSKKQRSYRDKARYHCDSGLAVMLNVPFYEKDYAKELGCKWNADLKKWYILENHGNALVVFKMWGSGITPVEKTPKIKKKSAKISKKRERLEDGRVIMGRTIGSEYVETPLADGELPF